MKKVKIMLLSLALFAVVGGALAFKAKLGNNKFCTAPAYFDAGSTPQYYCSFNIGGNEFTTKSCESYAVGQKIGTGTPIVCTTTTANVTTDTECQTLSCTSLTTVTA